MKEYVLAKWLLPIDHPPVLHGFLAVEDGCIVETGRIQDLGEDLRAGYDFERDITLLTPGLVNTHAHLEQSFASVIPLDLAKETMVDWLIRVTERNKLDSEISDREARSLAGAREMLASGTTCVNDISSDGGSLKALDTLGMRGVVSLEFFNPDRDAVRLEALFERFAALRAEYQGHGLLEVGLSPHSPYNVSPKAWQAVLQAYPNVFIHTHAAEFEDEALFLQGKPSCIDQLHERFLGRSFRPQASEEAGLTPVSHLAGFGLLRSRMVMAHGVHVSDADRQQLAQAGVGLAHCPRSNRHLHGKTLCWDHWRAASVPVGLGTDGGLSTETLDLRDEARAALHCHGWQPEEALDILTRGGARALGLAERIGTLTPGKAADFVVWQAPAALADLSPAAQVLHERTSARRVAVQGQTVWQPAECRV